MLIDSHCHLDRLNLDPYPNGLSDALAAAKENGVDHFLCVSIDLEAYPNMVSRVESFDQISISAGVHPTHDEGEEPTVERLVTLSEHPKNVAIGETGLDYFRSEGDLEWQRERFRTHIRAARETDKPLIIHMREATEDTLRIMKEERADQAGGVMHCFVEDWEVAQRAMDLGFLISFSGIVTFKNAKSLQDAAQRIPLDAMLVETDSPYLAPVPKRGKPNEPAYVRYVADFIAELRDCPIAEIETATSANYQRLFGTLPSLAGV